MRLEGMEALQAAVQRCPNVVADHLVDVITKTSYGVAQRAKATVPVETGALRDAIGYRVRGLVGRVTVEPGVHTSGRRPEKYWWLVEYGTVKTPARPVFRSAAEAESTQIEARLRAIVPNIERDFSAGRFL